MRTPAERAGELLACLSRLLASPSRFGTTNYRELLSLLGAAYIDSDHGFRVDYFHR
jgi:hypothetical protein